MYKPHRAKSKRIVTTIYDVSLVLRRELSFFLRYNLTSKTMGQTLNRDATLKTMSQKIGSIFLKVDAIVERKDRRTVCLSKGITKAGTTYRLDGTHLCAPSMFVYIHHKRPCKVLNMNHV
jgi:hypothetical protein